MFNLNHSRSSFFPPQRDAEHVSTPLINANKTTKWAHSTSAQLCQRLVLSYFTKKHFGCIKASSRFQYLFKTCILLQASWAIWSTGKKLKYAVAYLQITFQRLLFLSFDKSLESYRKSFGINYCCDFTPSDCSLGSSICIYWLISWFTKIMCSDDMVKQCYNFSHYFNVQVFRLTFKMFPNSCQLFNLDL